MGSQVNVKAVITAEDKASGVIAGVSNAFSKLALIAGGGALGSGLANQLKQAVDASNKAQNALIGLSSVAVGMGQDVSGVTSIAQSLSSDGLIPLTDSATALKNLLASGFNAGEAGVLLDSLKDKAAFNRQSFYDLGGAVVATTEGIKNGNSVLADAVGTTTNLSVMAKNAGISVDEMGSIAQNAGYRQAIMNGFIKDASINLGDAAKLADTFSGAQSKLATQINNVRIKIGDLVKGGLTPVIKGLADWIEKNQSTAVAMGVAVAAAGGFAAAIIAVAGAVALAVAIIGGPFTILLGAITALLGVSVFDAVKKVEQQMGKTSTGFEEDAAKIKAAAEKEMGAAIKQSKELTEKLADIDKQMAKTTRDFRESLAQIVSDHRQKVTDLTGQLAEENKAFAEAQLLKEQEFKISNQNQVRDHADKVSEITSQLNQELIAGTTANEQANAARVNDLRVRLAQENEAYNKQIAENELKYTQDATAAMAAHEAKKTDYQIQLDAETAFLVKHNADIASVRDVQLLDEIDKLKRNHGEQMAEYAIQKQKLVENDRSTTAARIQATNDEARKGQTEGFKDLGTKMGAEMASAVIEELKKGLKQRIIDTGLGINEIGSLIGNWVLNSFKLPGMPVGKRASGGPVGANQAYLVGEQGPELFVPGSTGGIVPNGQLGGGGSVTANVTISGVFMGTPAEARRLAQMVADNLKDIAGAKNQSVSQYMGG